MKHSLNKGFTLIELIVVIAVLGALSAIALPSFSGLVKGSSANVCEQNRLTLHNMYKAVLSQHRASLDEQVPFDEDSVATELEMEVEAVANYGKGATINGNRILGVCPEGGIVQLYSGNDGEYSFVCSKAGHGNTAVQLAQFSISEWLDSYNAAGNISDYSHQIVKEYLKNNESYKLTDVDKKEIFGDNEVRLTKTNTGVELQDMYLRPMGVEIGGKVQDVYIVTHEQKYNSSSPQANVNAYAVIVNGHVYSLRDKTTGKIVESNTNSGGAGGTYLYDIANISTSLDDLIHSLTVGAKGTTNGRFEQIK